MTTEAIATPTSGVAVLDSGADDGPYRVRGIALGEDDLTYGSEKTHIRWPREALEPAVSSLEGTKIVDDSEHWAPEGGEFDDDYPREPPMRTWVGEITDARYEEGVGILYEGEIDDERIASLIENGRVEPSPTAFHVREEADDEWVAQNITHWRDLALVDNGASPSASIEPDTSAVAAMSNEEVVATLSQAFDDDNESVASLASLDHLQYDGTSGGKLDESAIPDDSYKSHYIFPADSKSDSSFPVVDAEGNLRRGNVASAWDLRGHAPVSEDEVADMLRTLAKKFDDPPVSEEDVSSLSAGDDEDAQNSETEGAESPVDPADDTNMDFDLSDDEQTLIQQARTLDDPTVVEENVAALGSEVAQYDDPKTLESDEYDSLTDDVSRIKEVLGGVLAEQTNLKEDTVSALSLGAILGEFEDDEGDLNVSALTQEPETGDNGGESDTPDPSADEEGGDVEEQIAALEAKHAALRNTAAAPRIEEKIAALKED